jgi:hypothetical protein
MEVTMPASMKKLTSMIKAKAVRYFAKTLLNIKAPLSWFNTIIMLLHVKVNNFFETIDELAPLC